MIIDIPIQKAGTVKDLLEEELLIPRKIRHFLRVDKGVRLNGEAVHWQTDLEPGQILQLDIKEDYYEKKLLESGDPKLVQVLYEDEQVMIVNKPEGLKTHGNQPGEIALLNHVSSYCGQTCYVVHRLDKETSGAILFAKNPFILPILGRLLEERRIKREYWALAKGIFKEKSLTYRDPIGRDRHDPRKRRVDPKGQRAITHVKRIKSFKQHQLVACQLDTGRTHQIRVHLAQHGHAILGDPLYSPEKASRLMLHAHRLHFRHPLTGQHIQVEASSTSFEAILDQLKD